MRSTLVASLILVALFVTSLRADSFGSGANAFDIEFVTIGNPGNPADTTGDPNPAGSVAYSYRMGKYEISEQMIDKANAIGGLGITHFNRGPNKPAAVMNWLDAAKFVNWLNISQGETPAYKLDTSGNLQLWESSDPGFNPNNLYRNTLAKYFLPNVDEWYKAAYYDPNSGTYFDYPTGSDSPPLAVSSGTAPGTAVYNQSFFSEPADFDQAGGLSPYGTAAQGGNLTELLETEDDLENDGVKITQGPGGPIVGPAVHMFRGGSWAFPDLRSISSTESPPSFYLPGAVGFRVASTIPEPGAALLAGLATFSLLTRRRELL